MNSRPVTLYAQNGSVTGTVKDNNQEPLFGVNVSLKNITKGAQTNEEGVFVISNLENGNYTVI